MKKQFNINSVLAIVGMLIMLLGGTSCDDKLSVDPEDRVTPSTVRDYHGLLVGALSGTYHAFTELMTDNVIAKDYPAFNNPQVYSEWSKAYLWIDQRGSDEATSPEYAWRWLYSDLYKVNLVIADVMDAEGDPAFASHVKGEALLMRAYGHFMLVNLFARHYDSVTASTDLGIPIALEALDAGFHQFNRNTVQEVYDQIEKDLKEGMELINDEMIVKPKYHFTKVSALALASRIALYKREYEKVIDYSSQALAINPVLLDHLEFPYGNEGTFEVVEHANNYFSDKRENVYMICAGGFAVNYYKGGYYANEFKEQYSYRDLRSIQNFTFTNAAQPNFISIKLSLGFQQFNYPAFRTEETLLNRAEAYALLSDNTDNKADAIRDLNRLREKRFRPEHYRNYKFSDFSTKQELIDAVLLERKLELCYEGYRWFDLKRNGYPKLTHIFNGKEYILEENDLRYVLQIPDYELINNKEMKPNPR